LVTLTCDPQPSNPALLARKPGGVLLKCASWKSDHWDRSHGLKSPLKYVDDELGVVVDGVVVVVGVVVEVVVVVVVGVVVVVAVVVVVVAVLVVAAAGAGAVAAATTEVGSDVAIVVPFLLLAVTATRRLEPASAESGAYVCAVADARSEHADPSLAHRTH
jgi:hypothetical protein